jgi:hypothetical protein
VALAACFAAAPAAGQSNDEIQTATQFNVSTPGARSLGLGGAFVAVADDATAAYANPAGLAQLVASEAALEGRLWAQRSRFTERGHRPETGLTGIGIDVVDRLRSTEFEEDEAAVSFGSAVWAGGRWTAAAYRHQLADFRAGMRTQGPFVGFREASLRLSPAISNLDLRIAGIGASGALRLHEQLLAGVSVASYDFELASLTRRYARAPASGDPLRDSLTGGFYGPADFSPGNVLSLQTQEGDDRDVAWNAGLLWRPGGAWSLGAVYRAGPDFDFAASFVDGPASPTPGRVHPTLGGRGVFHVPDVWGAGAAWRPGERWLLAFDWTRVEYRDLRRDLVNLLEAAQGQLAGFTVDDADELHLGVEYQTLAPRLPLAIRLGAWFDPDHRLRFVGRDPPLRARFRSGRDELHVAGGVGVVFGRFQLDLAYDHAPSLDTLSLSGVRRF